MTVEPMSHVDAAWLHMDRPTNLMVVNTVVWTEQPVDESALREVLEQRLVRRFRRFRQRVADPAVTLGALSAPQWVDAEVDLDQHLRVTPLPAPGDLHAVQELCSRLASRPLERDRPLWELHLLTGFGAGSALLLRTHHAIADGAALMQVLMQLTDRADGTDHAGLRDVDRTAPRSTGSGVRGTAQRLVDAAGQAGAKAASLSAQALGALTDPRASLDLARLAHSDSAMLRKLGFGLNPPRNRLQGPLVPDKRLTWTRPVPLAAVKDAGRQTGCTVNDLMLAAIAGAFRSYLDEHDCPVDEVVACVPVDLRSKDAPLPSGLGNEFGLVFVALPTGEPDAARRQAVVKQRMDGIKSTRESRFIFSMLSLMGQVPAALQNRWIDVFAGKASAIVTNMTGPQHPAELAGTPVTGAMAWVPVTGPVGLGLSIVSYAGQVAIGLASDAQLLPDRDRLLDLLDAELEPLRVRTAV